MLERLDSIRWAELHHAYGPAADVPKQLRGLIASDAKTRDTALWELFGNIWHQGTVYEATAHAVPFLWEILVSAADCDRAGIAHLIGQIACGGGYHDDDNPNNRWEDWTRAASAAVQQGLAAAVPLLTSDDPTLRVMTVHIFACFPEDAVQNLPYVRAGLAREKTAARRAAFGIALALLGEVRAEAFAMETVTNLPLPRLMEFATRASQGKTHPYYALQFIVELAHDKVSLETIQDWLDDREFWGEEDEC